MLKFEITESGYDCDWKSMTIQGSQLQDCIDFIKKQEVKSVHIYDWKYSSPDISFLVQCPSVQEVVINSIFIETLDSLLELPCLEALTISRIKGNVNLRGFKNLKFLSADYREIQNLNTLEELEMLYLMHFDPVDGDFSSLKNLKKLKELSVIFSDVRSLEGIDALSSLKRLEISEFKKLRDISGLKLLADHLTALRIDDSKKIQDFTPIGDLYNLKELALCDDREIESIQFIEQLENLESFIFIGTSILDGNVAYCNGLRHVEFDDKKYYSNKNKEFCKDYD